MITTYFTSSSLDGFIADPADSLAWLFAQDHQDPADPALRYESLLARTGAIAMGATTYQWLVNELRRSQNGWPYQQPSWVFTHRELAPMPGADVRFVSGRVADAHSQISAEAAGNGLWIVGGGDLAGQFADAGLLDEIVVSIAPVTLGGGRPLLPRRLQLRAEQAMTAGGFMCARYRVDGPRPAADWT